MQTSRLSSFHFWSSLLPPFSTVGDLHSEHNSASSHFRFRFGAVGSFRPPLCFALEPRCRFDLLFPTQSRVQRSMQFFVQRHPTEPFPALPYKDADPTIPSYLLSSLSIILRSSSRE